MISLTYVNINPICVIQLVYNIVFVKSLMIGVTTLFDFNFIINTHLLLGYDATTLSTFISTMAPSFLFSFTIYFVYTHKSLKKVYRKDEAFSFTHEIILF